MKAVLLISHDRRLLANAADRIVTVESRRVWVHGGGFATYAQGRSDRFEGTVLAVTHDRWFAEDRHLVFGADGMVYESTEPVWHEGRVGRIR